MNSSIQIEHISKSYKNTTALRDVSFNVGQGELFGLIGPDGAGKTTLLRILTTLLLPDTGTAMLNGLDSVKDYKAIRNILGYMPGKFSLYHDLSVYENLSFFASIFGVTIKQNYELIKDIYVQIEPFKDRMAGKLSGGMKQKLALCCAMIHKPEILILDEPTTGVDALSRKEFWEMLKRLKNEGITIIVSTPYMDEANLCDRIALIQKGNILQINTPEGLVDTFSNKVFALKASNLFLLLQDLKHFPETISAYPFGEYLHIVLKQDGIAIQNLRDYLLAKKHQELRIQEIKPHVEDCFMDLMKQQHVFE